MTFNKETKPNQPYIVLNNNCNKIPICDYRIAKKYSFFKSKKISFCIMYIFTQPLRTTGKRQKVDF